MTKVPGLGSGLKFGWVVAAIIVVPLVICAVVAVADPSTMAVNVVVVIVFWFLMALLFSGRREIDFAHGVVSSRRFWVMHHVLRFDRLERCDVRDNHAGLLQLRLDDGRALYLPLLLSTGTPRSQQPGFLRALADSLAQHGSPPVVGETVAVLRAQADHVDSGAALGVSPLATYLGRR